MELDSACTSVFVLLLVGEGSHIGTLCEDLALLRVSFGGLTWLAYFGF